MSFNSPFSDSNQEPKNGPVPAYQPATNSDNSYADVPAYGSTPHVQPTGKNSTMSIVGFVLSILFPLVGLIISIIAWRQAAETGDNRGLAKAGIIVGAVLFALGIIANFVLFGAMTAATENGTLVSP